MMDGNWNPRFVAYASAHGRTPEAMLEHDTEAWPGGKMCGFILWIKSAWSEWYIRKGFSRRDYIKTQADHADFDQMLLTFPPLAQE